jgi:DNA-binding NarL/FixJ family response regulator
MEPNNDCIRILIVDDQVIARSGLRAMLSDRPQFQIVGEAADGVQAVEMAATHQSDLI